jgi:hypothetical protein
MALRERQALEGRRALEMQQSKKATSSQWPIAERGYAGPDE